MAKTAINTSYTGLVDEFPIDTEIHKTEDKVFAVTNGVVPIHCCSPEKVEELAPVTHHYTDIFTENILAPVDDILYVRLDEKLAEKVFVNRHKKMLITSYDGILAVWRSAPIFESNNNYIAGTPIVNKQGQLVSIVTAKKGNFYALSSFECEGGYFEASAPWKIIPGDNQMVYGMQTFTSKDDLIRFVSTLDKNEQISKTIPVIHAARIPRISLVAETGKQISHLYLPGVILGAEYL